jgi:hypothetical protein
MFGGTANLGCAFSFSVSPNQKFNQGEIYAFANRQGPRITLSIHFH